MDPTRPHDKDKKTPENPDARGHTAGGGGARRRWHRKKQEIRRKWAKVKIQVVQRGGEANSLKQQQNGQLELETEPIKLNECNTQIMMR